VAGLLCAKALKGSHNAVSKKKQTAFLLKKRYDKKRAAALK